MVTLTFSFNKAYVSYAKVLVNSIKANSPNTAIVARAVNVSRDIIKENWCQDVSILFDDTTHNTKKTKIKSLKDNLTCFWSGDIPRRSLLYSEETSYTCHSRFLNILYLLQKGVDNIFCVDADFIVRGDLSLLSSYKKDIHIMHKFENNCAVFTDEDAIFLKNTTQTTKFITDIYNTISQRIDFWDIDTVALNDTYSVYKKHIKLHQLDMKYKDYNLENSSLVWSGDGGAKFHEKFIAESKLYL